MHSPPSPSLPPVSLSYVNDGYSSGEEVEDYFCSCSECSQCKSNDDWSSEDEDWLKKNNLARVNLTTQGTLRKKIFLKEDVPEGLSMSSLKTIRVGRKPLDPRDIIRRKGNQSNNEIESNDTKLAPIHHLYVLLRNSC